MYRGRLAGDAESVADGDPICPIDDRGIFGAQLAVVRAMAGLGGQGAPFIGAEQGCRIPTLNGFVRVYREEPERPPSEDLEGDYAPAYAAEVFARFCFRSVPGHDDGCVLRARCGGEDQAPCQASLDEERVVLEPGMMRVTVLRPRSALGCGSIGEREYLLRRVNGLWQVEREDIVAYGNHSQ